MYDTSASRKSSLLCHHLFFQLLFHDASSSVLSPTNVSTLDFVHCFSLVKFGDPVKIKIIFLRRLE